MLIVTIGNACIHIAPVFLYASHVSILFHGYILFQCKCYEPSGAKLFTVFTYIIYTIPSNEMLNKPNRNDDNR